jgi:hypothetical protein
MRAAGAGSKALERQTALSEAESLGRTKGDFLRDEASLVQVRQSYIGTNDMRHHVGGCQS